MVIGSIIICRYECPISYLPASTLSWAQKADTRSFTGMLFSDFLVPPS